MFLLNEVRIDISTFKLSNLYLCRVEGNEQFIGTSPSILRSFYTCTVESILTGCITAWFGNSTAGNRKTLRTVRHIVGGELPSLQDIYTRRCTRKARRIIKDSSHPSHRLLSLLPSGRLLRSIRSRTSRLRHRSFPQAIRLMNSQN